MIYLLSGKLLKLWKGMNSLFKVFSLGQVNAIGEGRFKTLTPLFPAIGL